MPVTTPVTNDVAVACVPLTGASMVTTGGVVYPEPAFVIAMPVTDDAIAAVATAPVPPPPVKETVGAEAYPVPGAVTVTPLTMPVIAAVAVAWIPPAPAGGAMVTVGDDV